MKKIPFAGRILIASFLAASLPGMALAQPSSGSGSTATKNAKPRPTTHAQKKAAIDLEAQAKERRPGQVLPGDLGPGHAPPPDAKPVTPAQSQPAPEGNMPAGAAAATIALPSDTPQAEPAPATATDAALDKQLDAAAGNEPPTEQASPPPRVRSASPEVMVEPGVIQNPAPPAGYTPARVRIADPGTGRAEWRSALGAWTPIESGQKSEARVEVRAGLDSAVVLVVDDTVEIRIARLGRVTIERATEPDGAVTVSMVLARGMIEVKKLESADAASTASASRFLARIRTPDRSIALTAPAELSYDAFAGTRVRLLARGE